MTKIIKFIEYLRWRSFGWFLHSFLIALALFMPKEIFLILCGFSLSLFCFHSYRIYKNDDGHTHKTLVERDTQNRKEVQELLDDMQKIVIELGTISKNNQKLMIEKIIKLENLINNGYGKSGQ